MRQERKAIGIMDGWRFSQKTWTKIKLFFTALELLISMIVGLPQDINRKENKITS